MRRPVTRSPPAPAKAAPATLARSGFPVWLTAILLVLVTIALYWPATGHDFVNYDDDAYVYQNAHVQSGLSWEAVKWAFLNPVCCNWHPFTVLSHMLDCQEFGLKPWGHHLTSVLLHALNAALVFALLQEMTGARWRSLVVAALFALHPLRVESVAWVAERKDVLSGCFGLLALIAYARYAQGRSHKPEACGLWSVVRGPRFLSHLPSSVFSLLSLFFFALGLMSKPMLVTWPFVLLLLDYWPLRRSAECGMPNAEPGARGKVEGHTLSWMKLVWEKIPCFALAAAASVVTFVVQKHGGSLMAADKLPLGARGGNALISYCRYLGKLFWPADLAVFYPLPQHWPPERVLLAGGLILGISVLAFVLRRRSPFLLMGWLWFVGTLVPVIGLVQVGGQAMADRYSYLPSQGVLVCAVWGAYELTRRWRYHVIALSLAGSAAIVLCMVLTRQQLGYWKNSETLFRHALDVTQNNYLAHDNLGTALSEKGQIDEAIRQYQEAIRLNPDYDPAHNNLGMALGEKGQINEAIGQFQEAIRLKPDDAEPHINLGIALGRKGQIDEAIRQYQEAIRLKPDDLLSHYNLGNNLGMKGQINEAIRQYQEAIRLKPDYAEAHNNLGTILARKGQMDEAIRQFQEALRLKPDYAEARTNLARALGMKNAPGVEPARRPQP